MKLSPEELWVRFQKLRFEFPSIELAMDLSRMNFPTDYFDSIRSAMAKAFGAMEELEKGAIANPDEHRMVGHYWLRNSQLAPTETIQNEIEQTFAGVKEFAAAVHSGQIRGSAGPFKNLLLIGIGGSALGPQFISAALGNPRSDSLKLYFFDNTDPDGMDKVLESLGASLGQTLVVVISKSGGTKETRNGMLEAKAAYEKAGLKFNDHVVAVTGVLSELDKTAQKEEWLRRFPMWDWVGGRTSIFSAVGLLPAALQGINIDELILGAKQCDEVTRQQTTEANPAALLALTWHYASQGQGSKDMVLLPYKDRLELFSRYLQQLIMESLGKEFDLEGHAVHQGLSVFGNKGSTDQHAFVQQLRDGVNNFFAVFIQVLRERRKGLFMVESETTSGDYLQGFYLGTRQALYEKDRESITVTVDEVRPFTIGVLIALFERAVGLYASMVKINAYHQPGVEAGKKAAGAVIALQLKVLRFLRDHVNQPLTGAQIASGIGAHEAYETVFHICEYLSAQPERKIEKGGGTSILERTYRQL